jgi:hypothetical protein
MEPQPKQAWCNNMETEAQKPDHARTHTHTTCIPHSRPHDYRCSSHVVQSRASRASRRHDTRPASHNRESTCVHCHRAPVEEYASTCCHDTECDHYANNTHNTRTLIAGENNATSCGRIRKDIGKRVRLRAEVQNIVCTFAHTPHTYFGLSESLRMTEESASRLLLM